MAQSPRELVRRCLRFEHPARVPRDLWTLPWADRHLPETVAELRRRYPSDFADAPGVYAPSARRRGDPYAAGESRDDWGCCFVNLQAGVHGEVKAGIVRDLADWRQVTPPYETLPGDAAKARDTVNRACAATDKAMRAGACPRPWERYQFLRGSEAAFLDVADPDADVRGLLAQIHAYYLRELEFWVTTDVDIINFMDDWGAQDRLLISPARWRELFQPIYRDYVDLAHAHGKFIFMHSDGNITAIYPDLVALGVDAVNSQLFCMDLDVVARAAKGRLTFWGEIDRQHVLPARDPAVGRAAVRRVAERLYDPAGGVIAQFELGAGACGETALAIFDEWERIGTPARPEK